MQFRNTIGLVLLLLLIGKAEAQNSVRLDAEEIESYSKQSEQIIKYLEGTLNFLGDKTEVASEKDIIINESYLKMFVDDKVQIEDDLDENREIALSKDVQAYFKDVDFFFKEVEFNFIVNSVENFVNDKGQIYFKASVNRNLKGITIEDDTIDNNQIRYFEINLNTIEKDLKIASIYTTLPNKKQEMAFWWNNMAESWKDYFSQNILIYDTLPFSNIISFDDSSLVAYKWVDNILTDTFLIKESDTIHYSNLTETIVVDNNWYVKYDTVSKKFPDTLIANTDIIYTNIEKFRSLKKVDISNSILIGNLQPISELTKLEEINISNTLIDELMPLRNLNNLEKINCNGTPLTIIEALRYSSALKEINVSFTPIQNIEILSNLKNLENLDISNTQITNFRALSNLQHLRQINISGLTINRDSNLDSLILITNLIAEKARFTDFKILENLQKLQHLNIDSSNIENLNPLSKLKELNVLQANNTNISNLNSLLDLPELKLVYCDNTKVNKAEAQIFIEEKPDCMVIYNTAELAKWWNDLSDDWHSIAYSRIKLDSLVSKEQLHEIVSIKSINLANNQNITDLSPLRMLYRLEALNVDACPIMDVEPLKSLRNLSLLNISNTNVKSVKPLENLANLRIVKCENTEISDINFLKNNSHLEYVYADNSDVSEEDAIVLKDYLPEAFVIFQTDKLNMWWENLSSDWQDLFIETKKIDLNPRREQLQELIDSKYFEIKNTTNISDLEVLSVFSLLEEITISNTSINDISAITFLPRLKKIVIPNNPIYDISSLSRIKILEELNIENTSVDDLESIKNAENLKVLSIAGTKVKNLKALQNLKNLEVLKINNTRIKSIKQLEGLSKLKEFKCYNTGIKSSKIETFNISHPDCEVVYY
jgi:Leucine-rich repeat (LRR) protein